MKSAHEIAVDRSDDDMIVLSTETDLGRYYRLGNKVTVRNSGNHWLCLTCSGPDRVEFDGRKGCSHIARVKRYVEEHSEGAAA